MAIGLFCFPIFSQAYILEFVHIAAQSFSSHFVGVHFAAGGNDHVAGLFVTQAKSLDTPQILSISGQTISCTKQLQ